MATFQHTVQDVQVELPPPSGAPTEQQGLGPWALARLLTMALLFGAAAVPAFLGGMDVAGWCLALLAVALASRFPMAGLCAVMGGGAYVALVVASLIWPLTFGPSGLFETDPWLRATAWLVLAASLASLTMLDVPTFTQAFRREGRPVASWHSVGMGKR